MHQPGAVVTAADIERLVARDFAVDVHDEVWRILRTYGAESWHNEVARVRAAMLKVADGDVARLRAASETATQDYRDALVAAEYPNAWQRTPLTRDLPEAERREVYGSDKAQYDAWFHRP